MSQPVITIVSPSGDSIEVTGRVARMILWMVGRRDQIASPPAGNVQIHFSRDQIKPSFTANYPSDEELEAAVVVPPKRALMR